MDLVLNNLQGLYAIKPTNQPINIYRVSKKPGMLTH